MDMCIYCGDSYQCRDHIIPISYQSAHRYYKRGDTVKACHQCNTFLSDKAHHSVVARARYLITCYHVKYTKLLGLPVWSTEELDVLGYNLRTKIELHSKLKQLYLKKLQNLEFTANGFDILPLNEIEVQTSTEEVEEESSPAPVHHKQICKYCNKLYTNSRRKVFCSATCGKAYRLDGHRVPYRKLLIQILGK